MQNLSDYELMLLVKGKQHAALSALYDRYAGLVYSFAWKALREEAAAKDIVQAVYLRLWTTESSYDPEKGKFTNWLLTIVRNITADVLRKRRKENVGVLHYLREDLERIPDRLSLSPEQQAEHQFVKEQIRGAYRHLSKQQITLLEHFYWQGYTLSELAALYDQPLGTVKNRLHQTLKILRRHLSAEGVGTG
ncbi:RNA polymerase sigma factor [Paenibacillus sacheonensis]|uniref:Sigma-70 family RNA polymerase sigma factor n=1 Tax=Paenibacillus sacheonensis TaxID=742054 RepID=A0A7X5BWM9_9BACL|nr:sigma-70 family RNA polymerase sigma factor [Paenibacillus sacheonensis]MBM7563962.1 RNA polymerase sigma-70 factor (ECF subfamily) [Paenibacillus sacheonensis]NBC67697.1 sigma-70 family RNA polymerase sigma factor [Paenibacillus sacheonensis]